MRDATGRDALRSLVGISKCDRVVIVACHPMLFSNHGEAISLFSEQANYVSGIADQVFLIRGVKDRFDYDMAELYNRESRILNQAVDRDRD